MARKTIYKVFDVLIALALGFLISMLFILSVSKLDNPNIIPDIVIWMSLFIWQFVMPYKFIDILWNYTDNKEVSNRK